MKTYPFAIGLIHCVVRKEVLEGLLGADLVGFQTYSFARHFLQTCSRLLSVESNPKGIQLENTAVNVGIFPIGKCFNVPLQSMNSSVFVCKGDVRSRVSN